MIFKQIILRRPNIIHKLLQRTMSQNPPSVIFEDTASAGIITLNRPKALNALNLEMVKLIQEPMQRWETSKSLVIIKANGGKAFCAGGDIKALVQSEDKTLSARFMRAEYTLNHMIGTYKIPYVALIDGITMGGGVGLSMHGKYRIATETTMFAMPETAIGLFPDVGGSYILSRLPGQLGMYLGLTGVRLKGKDVLASGLATHYCDRTKLPELTEKLSTTCKSDTDVKELLKHFCLTEVDSFVLNNNLKQINSCFKSDTVEGIIKNLELDGSEWAKSTLDVLSKMCPQSVKITHSEIQRAKSLSLAECLQMEYRLVYRITGDYNFAEGVRAVVIDKTMQPKWNPDKLENVTIEKVNSFFDQLPNDIELKL